MQFQSFPVLLFLSLACTWSSVVAETRAPTENVTAISPTGANITCFKGNLAGVAKDQIAEALSAGKLQRVSGSLTVWEDPTKRIKISTQTVNKGDVVTLDEKNFDKAFDEIEAACGEKLPLSGKKGQELTQGSSNIWKGTLVNTPVQIYLGGLEAPQGS